MSEAPDKVGRLSAQSGPGSENAKLEIWRQCRYYTVAQAALLIAGHDPANAIKVERSEPEERPQGYEAAKHAIEQALAWDQDMGRAAYLSPTEYPTLTDRIDVQKSIVWSSRLKAWSLDRGIATEFFSPAAPAKSVHEVPDYLDPKNPRFTPKLAAAVRAWQAIGQVGPPAKMSPKKALEAWLTAHAKELGLVNRLGELNATGIEEAAKVANWQTEGGAPKTSIGS